ncbi:uncharacterized protein A4U43_C02F20140 [Asparagus officinalis]|uniref:Uncharacterized protein n=1 Tax=Asparagus officinalis TaxID=4686 RepID=A0A5P1FLG4_ASPOF|nr:uncharacterized protein A4U43_C02F20140 [Asparagus officinalis]
MSVDLRRRRRRMVNVMAKIVKKGKVKHEYPWPHKIEPDPNVKGGILSPSRSPHGSGEEDHASAVEDPDAGLGLGDILTPDLVSPLIEKLQVQKTGVILT